MMIRVLKLMAEGIGLLQQLLKMIFGGFGVISDKQQHFWAIGIIGLFIFILSDLLFKKLAQWSITAISFVFSLTLVLVIVFGLEIVQMVTGTGVVEFGDVVAGLWGFFVFLTAVLAIRALIRWMTREAQRGQKNDK